MGLPRRRVPRFLRKFPLLLRFLPLLAALELSGFAHSLADFVTVIVEHGHHESDCDDEQGGRSCDPGCPGCHCAHAGPTIAPSHGPLAVLTLDTELTIASPASAIPPSPDRAPPFRPPRCG